MSTRVLATLLLLFTLPTSHAYADERANAADGEPLATVDGASLTATKAPAGEQRAAPDFTELDRLIQRKSYLAAFEASAGILRSSYQTNGAAHPHTAEALKYLTVVSANVERDLCPDLITLYQQIVSDIYGSEDPVAIDARSMHADIMRRFVDYEGGKLALETAARQIEPYRDSHPELYFDVNARWASSMRWGQAQRSEALQEELIEFRRERLGNDYAIVVRNLWRTFTRLHNGDHDIDGDLDTLEAELTALGLADTWLYGTVMGMRGELAILDENWDAAEVYFQKCAQLHEAGRRQYSHGFTEIHPHGPQYTALVLAKGGRFEEAWRELQRNREQATVDFQTLALVRSKAPESAGQLEVLGQRYLAAQTARSSSEPGSERYWRLLLDELDVKVTYNKLARQLISEHRPPTPTVADIASRLPEKGAYIGWNLLRVANWHASSSGDYRESLMGFVIRSDGSLHWLAMEEQSERVAEVVLLTAGAHWDAAQSWGERIENDVRMNRILRTSGQHVFDPLEPYLTDVDQLIVEYSGVPTSHPVEAMIGRDGRSVGERFAVSYTPCALSYKMLMDAPAPKAPGECRVLAMGDPAFKEQEGPIDTQVVTREILTGRLESIEELPPLPHSRSEVEAIAVLFDDVDVLLRENAREQHFARLASEDKLAGYDVMHFATHALMDLGIQQRCALAMSPIALDGTPGNDGLIEAREILFSWRTDAQLMVLSACQTAQGNYFSGEPLGFMQTLFAAGTRSVIASAWKVDDEVAWLMTRRFYENWTGRYSEDRGMGHGVAMSKTRALFEARRFIRTYEDESGARPFTHPLYWTSYQLVGDPR